MSSPVVQGTITAGALIAFFKVVLVAFRLMGWLTPEQEVGWGDVVELGVPLLVITGTGWWIARKTTSLAQPTDVDGVRLSRPDNTPALEERKTIAKEIFRERSA